MIDRGIIKWAPFNSVVPTKKIVNEIVSKKNKISIGYCAKIAEMNKEDFIRFLGDNGVSIFSYDSEDEFVREINNA